MPVSFDEIFGAPAVPRRPRAGSLSFDEIFGAPAQAATLEPSPPFDQQAFDAELEAAYGVDMPASLTAQPRLPQLPEQPPPVINEPPAVPLAEQHLVPPDLRDPRLQPTGRLPSIEELDANIQQASRNLNEAWAESPEYGESDIPLADRLRPRYQRTLGELRSARQIDDDSLLSHLASLTDDELTEGVDGTFRNNLRSYAGFRKAHEESLAAGDQAGAQQWAAAMANARDLIAPQARKLFDQSLDASENYEELKQAWRQELDEGEGLLGKLRGSARERVAGHALFDTTTLAASTWKKLTGQKADAEEINLANEALNEVLDEYGGRGGGERLARGVGSSLFKGMLLARGGSAGAGALGGANRARLAAGVIAQSAGFGESARTQTYAQASMAPLTEGERTSAADKQGAIEAGVMLAFSAVGAGLGVRSMEEWLAGSALQGLKKTALAVGSELSEESLTTWLQDMASKASGLTPDDAPLWPQMRDTWLQTGLALGLVEGSRRIAQFVSRPNRRTAKDIGITPKFGSKQGELESLAAAVHDKATQGPATAPVEDATIQPTVVAEAPLAAPPPVAEPVVEALPPELVSPPAPPVAVPPPAPAETGAKPEPAPPMPPAEAPKKRLGDRVTPPAAPAGESKQQKFIRTINEKNIKANRGFSPEEGATWLRGAWSRSPKELGNDPAKVAQWIEQGFDNSTYWKHLRETGQTLEEALRSITQPTPTQEPTDAGQTRPLRPAGEGQAPTRPEEGQPVGRVPSEPQQEKEAAGGPEGILSPQRQLSESIAARLNNDSPIGRDEFFSMADREYGGSRAEGKYGDSDAYDALETGVNAYVHGKFDPTVEAREAKQQIAKLERLVSRLPQHKARTGEKDTLQQFSTPPAYAYLANWVANIGEGDVVLEPSAGTGGLAVHALNAGAAVYGNEIDEGRAALLSQLPLAKVFNEDAEHIASILKSKMPTPTVVVMNPPFSRAGRRLGDKMVPGTDRKHIDEALRLLPDDGRLVAIVGAGLHGRGKGFDNWLADLPYNVRADLELGRDVYKGYGTTFPTRLLVIDKALRTEGVVSGSVATLAEAVDLLEGVRNERQATGRQKSDVGQPSGQGPRPTQGGQRPVSPGQPATGAVGAEQAPQPDARPSGKVRVGTAGGSQQDVGVEQTGDSADAGQRGTGQPDGRQPDVPSGAPGREPAREPTAADAEPPAGSEQRVGEAEAQAVSRSKRKKELGDSTYEPYATSITFKGAVKHPASLVESAAMAAIDSPAISYRPKIDAKVIKGYKAKDGTSVGISDAQLEAVALAGQAHSQLLGNGERRGFLIGDGTGVGKAREIAGIILDNWNQGRRRAVWVSKNDALYEPGKEEWGRVGGDKDKIFKQKNAKSGGAIEAKEGILYTTYSMLRGEASDQAKAAGNAKSRIEQIVDWLGPDFDGAIIFDEAHLMGNATDSGSGMNKKTASRMALSGVDLQARLPKARITYLSATSATEVANLAYAGRLGLWGEGTPFANRQSFINKITAGGVAAMEKIAADMKALGMYIARNIAFNDGTEKGTVTYDRIEHPLTADQERAYDKMSEAWHIVFQNMNEALEITEGAKSGPAVMRAKSNFWASELRFFNQVITAMQTPAVIRAIERDLAEGRSAVIQLTNTNESAQKRALAKRSDEDDLGEVDVSPKYILMDYVERSFPTTKYEEFVDENGNIRMRPVLDSAGNPVHDSQAMAMKERLLDELGSLQVANRGALDMIIDHFGEDAVAEVTGRTERLVQREGKTTREKRSMRSNKADMGAFMDGRKRVLVFSEAGGTGASYHADLSRKNPQKRHHYLLQAGWRADTAIQGLGRTHRSNQAQAPKYLLVHTNLKGQKRFLSTIARRLSQLGAITKGSRQTGSQGVFSAADNLESTEAREALQQLLQDVHRNVIEGMSDAYFLDRLGLALADEHGNMLAELPPVTQFMNRVMSLPVKEQNNVFDEFQKRIDSRVEAAIASGTLDQGMETLKADSIKKLTEQTVYRDPTGAETKHVVVRVGRKTKPLTWARVHDLAGVRLFKHSGIRGYVRSKKTGKVLIAEDTGITEQDKQGRLTRRVKLYTPLEPRYSTEAKLTTDNWEVVGEAEAKTTWDQQVADAPEVHEQDMHIISGVLFPIWDRMPENNVQVKRLLTDDGEQILGRVIPSDRIREVLKKLGASMDAPKLSPEEAVNAVQSGSTLVLANDWRIKRSRVEGEWVIEIVGPDYSHESELERQGVMKRRVDYNVRYFVPIGAKSGEVLGAVLKSRPVADVLTSSDQITGALESATRGPLLQPSTSRVVQAGIETGQTVNDWIERPATPQEIAEHRGATFGMGLQPAPRIAPKQIDDAVLGPSDLKSNDQEVEQQWQRSKYRPSYFRRLDRAVESALSLARSFTRKWVRLDPKEYGATLDVLRLAEEIPNWSKAWSANVLRGIVAGLGPQKFDVFTRVLILRDLQKDVDRGLYVQLSKNKFDDPAPKPLPFGYTPDTLKADLRKFEAIAGANPDVAQAIDRRQKFMTTLRHELVERDLLPEQVLKFDDYFHHQVLQYMEGARYEGTGIGFRRLAPQKKGWQRRRLGSDLNYNTEYLDAEFAVVSQAMQQIKIQDLLKKLRKMNDLKPHLKELAGKEWKQNIPDGYVLWQPVRGNVFYPAMTVSEKALQNYLADVDILTDDDFRKVWALGAKRDEWVIPQELAATLDDFRPREEIIIEKAVAAGQNRWKKWRLVGFPYVLKYNLNNFSGDLDATLAYNPKISGKYAASAGRDLRQFHKGAALTPELSRAIELGVIGSGTLSELSRDAPALTDHQFFAALYGRDEGLIKRLWKAPERFTAWREDILRLASYRFFLDELKAGKKPYAASRAKEIDQMRQAKAPREQIAARLARDLIGDYGNVSQAGTWIRSHLMPFYSWIEINTPRYLRLFKNAPAEGVSQKQIAGMAGKRLVAVAAGQVAKRSLQAGILYGMINLWNLLVMGDLEDELTDEQRRELHIILGRREDGTVMTLRIQGALSDALSWVGMEDLPADVTDLVYGRASVQDKIEEGAKAPVNRIVSGSMPIPKAIAEAAAGRSFYPDLFDPRPVRDPLEHLARLYIPTWLYRKATGKPDRTNSASDMVLDLVTYSNDPGEAAYYTVRNLASQWQRERGEEPGSFTPGAKSNALYYYKQAIKYKDRELAEKWHSRYMALGGSNEGMRKSIEATHPVGFLSRTERADFVLSLRPEELAVFKRAVTWYDRTYTPDAKPADPVESVVGDAARHYAELALLSTGQPEKATQDESLAERTSQWKRERVAAAQWLRTHKASPAVRSAVQDVMNSDAYRGTVNTPPKLRLGKADPKFRARRAEWWERREAAQKLVGDLVE